MDNICSTLGGRAAEELTFGRISTGALNDLEKVTKQAYAMVAYYGMSDKLYNLSYYDSTGQSAYNFGKPYSEKTAELMDQEARRIVGEQYERAKQVLRDNKEKHKALAELLLEREVVFSEDLERIFGVRKGQQIEEQKQIEQKKIDDAAKAAISDMPKSEDDSEIKESNTDESKDSEAKS